MPSDDAALPEQSPAGVAESVPARSDLATLLVLLLISAVLLALLACCGAAWLYN
ncbi:hypothetical protein [Micromonospora chokoriensis]|uniref:Uncharacterized protein n=1 Tax=Micromonospora chokoriensis TaxID=356851 RepID=A0A1C4YDN9_9ACTN|nr:hypothetical protein [Micromonospora chokoriensis]SCF18746.1 hypothetical protein GA0070612_4592 [Micromonospora chokoriensis]